MRNATVRRITALIAGAGLIITGLLAGEGRVRTSNDSGRHASRARVTEAEQVHNVASGQSDAAGQPHRSAAARHD